MKKIRVSKFLQNEKRTEDIGIVSTQFATHDNTRNVFKRLKSNTSKEIVRLKREGRTEELNSISLGKAYAELIAKLSFEFSGKETHPIVVKRIWEKWTPTFLKLDKILRDLKLPVVLYLRIHLKLTGGRIIIPALATSAAINRFADYLERDIREKYIFPKDVENAIAELSFVEYTDHLRQLLTEYRLGKSYLEKAKSYAPMMDSELVSLVELNNLPGGYLVAMPELKQFREQGLLSKEVSDKIEEAETKLSSPGIREAFFREVRL